MYQHTSSALYETDVGCVGYCKRVPVSLVQPWCGASVGGGSVVGVAVQIGGVGVGGADVGGGSVKGAEVSPTIHVSSKLLSSKPPALKLMYISPPLLLLTRTLFPPIRYRDLKEEWSAFMTNRSAIPDGLRTKVNHTDPG